LLPTNHYGFANPNDSILARRKVLTKLLNCKDIKLLFEKSHWLDTKITFVKTRELREYLMHELEIHEIDFGDFSDSITEEFMKSKKDEWVIDYYSELIDRDALFRERSDWQTEGVLRNKPIIRLKYNKHCSPFDSSGKIQVYLPIKTKSSYKTVKDSIAKNEKALETLLAYNIEDIINLEYLMHKVYNLKLIETPFENELVMLIPNRPNIPFLPDLATIKKIKAQFYEPEYYPHNTEQKSAIWSSLKELF